MTEPTEPQPRAATADDLPRWTIGRMRTFMDTLRRTRSVAAAARAAGMSRQAAYRLRARLPAGHPFDRAWAAALAPREAFRLMTTGYAPAAGDRTLQGVTPGHRG